MSSANRLLFVLAASSGVMSSGQFLKPMETHSVTSSWMSSSYWAPGRDGQMHQKVHEVRSETFHDHGVPVKHTESETACKDGLCQQTVSIEKPGSITVMTKQAPAAQGRWSQSIGMPARLRNMLNGLSVPIMIVDDREAPVNLKFLAPRPQPAMYRTAVAPGAQDVPDFVPLLALGGIGMSLAALIVTAMAQCLRSDSREVPLRSLGEPLAPGEEARVAGRRAAGRSAKSGRAKSKKAKVTPEAMPVAPEAMPVGAYLDRVYTRAVETTETTAAKAYLYRVYEQATA